MNIAISCLLVFAATVAAKAEADPQYPYYGGYGIGYGYPAAYPPMPHYDNSYAAGQANYFRAGLPTPSFESQAQKQDGRIFLGTVTVTLATTTSTSTITTSTTCTTSARAISICSPSGRRRRGLGLNLSPKTRGLFYNDEEEKADNASIFTRSDEPETAPVAPAVESAAERQARSSEALVPFVVQPGFNAPEAVRGGRFLVTFGTSTTIITTTSTYTAILTAACRSTTSFSTCPGNGK